MKNTVENKTRQEARSVCSDSDEVNQQLSEVTPFLHGQVHQE